MQCLTCESIAVADCLCVPCGAKLWVSEARLYDRRSDLASLNENNPLDAERLKARGEIKDIGDALAFETEVMVARAKLAKKIAKIARVDQERA